jgi:hypothetical protein
MFLREEKAPLGIKHFQSYVESCRLVAEGKQKLECGHMYGCEASSVIDPFIRLAHKVKPRLT